MYVWVVCIVNYYYYYYYYNSKSNFFGVGVGPLLFTFPILNFLSAFPIDAVSFPLSVWASYCFHCQGLSFLNGSQPFP